MGGLAGLARCSRGWALTQHASAGHVECVAYLLKRRANPAAANKQGKTALDAAKSEEVKAMLTVALEAATAAAAAHSAQPGASKEPGAAAPVKQARKRPAEAEPEAVQAASAAGQEQQAFRATKRAARVQLQEEGEEEEEG